MKDALFLFCIGCLILTLQASSWHERKRSHKSRSLRTNKLISIAKLSDGDQFEYFKNEILKPFLRVRVSDTDGNRIVREHIKTQMQSLDWSVEENTFTDMTPLGQKSFTNVIAVHNPQATRRLTLACHYDSKYFTEFEFIGATDSAVPCALLIDLARHLNTSLAKHRDHETTLQFLFFDGEEAFVSWTDTDSIYGARHLAAKMEATLVEVEREVAVSQLQTMDLMILLDLIGTEDMSFTSYFTETSKYFERLQKIELRLAKESLLEPASLHKNGRNKYFLSDVWNSGSVQDDHIPFLARNVPVLHLIANPFPSVWHTARDNEASLSYSTINDLGKILRIFVAEYLQLSV